MTVFKPTYKQFGERAVLMEWPQVIDKAVLNDIIIFTQKIRKFDIESIIEIKSAYNSLLIIYNDLFKGFDTESQLIDKIYTSEGVTVGTDAFLWKIPVCYEGRFAVDLEMISKEKNLSKEDIIALHSKTVYTVYFSGFLPGFLYLGGLEEKLHFPRKPIPRLRLEKGSVAIGGNQTGVYPVESPGGWNIIGNCPIEFFDVHKDNPCFAKAGDRIVFYPISLKEHRRIESLVKSNSFKLESEVIND